MLKLYSDIYPPDIKPVRDGWYLAREPNSLYPDPYFLRWFTNNKWHHLSGDLLIAQNQYWRGLAFDPDAAELAHHDVVSVSSQRIVTIRGAFLPGAEVE